MVYRIIPSMKRIDVHLKVVVDIGNDEDTKRLGEEMVRVLKKLYGVRKAEVTSVVEEHG